MLLQLHSCINQSYDSWAYIHVTSSFSNTFNSCKVLKGFMNGEESIVQSRFFMSVTLKTLFISGLFNPRSNLQQRVTLDVVG